MHCFSNLQLLLSFTTVLILQINFIKTHAQISMDNYIEVMNNSVSQGFQNEYSTQLTGSIGNFKLTSGGLFRFSDTQSNALTAYHLQPSLDLKLFKKVFTIGAFYLWKPFSDNLRETNYGIISDIRTKHFGFGAGLNTRNYSFSKAAINNFQIQDDTPKSVREVFNLMYKLSFHQPLGKKLNMELKVSNFDSYIIQQVTNPIAISKFTYKVNSKLRVYNHFGLMQAGMLNLKINYFGFYCRGGMEWQIN